MKVLHAIHDFLPRHRAGSQIYAFHLCQELARRHSVTVVCAEYDPSRAHGSVCWRAHEGLPVAEIVNNWHFSTLAETYESPVINGALRQVLDAVNPDVLHVHNLLNLSMDLPILARERRIPVVATLHDYTLVCPSGGQRVHMAEQHVCYEIDPDRCSRCFPQSPFFSQMAVSAVAQVAPRSPMLLRVADMVRRRMPRAFSAVEHSITSAAAATITRDDIARRLDRVRDVFDAIDLFVAPSRSLGEEYRKLGLPGAKLRISDYGFVPLARPRRVPGDRLRIGFVGTLAWHKGAHVLVEAVGGLPAEKFEVHLFGDLTVFPGYVSTLRDAVGSLPVRFMGGFDGSRVGAVYDGIDVLVVSSLWPENSPLVIHEAFMAGVPVVGARQGGIPELVTDRVNGLVYDAYSPADLRSALQRLIDEPDLLERFSRALPPVKSIAQDAAEWEAIYEDPARRVPAEPSSR